MEAVLSKYEPFGDYLNRQKAGKIRLSFSQIEKILGDKLPASKRYPAWWSNNTFNSVMTKIWLHAGWKSQEVDTENEEVSFVRVTSSTSHATDNKPDTRSPNGAPGRIDLDQLDPVARNVLVVLARRSNRSPAEEAIHLLNEALTA
jgi:hypothetical protein